MLLPSASRISSSLGRGIAPQQSGRRHDESRRAIAALRAELFVEPALHGGQPPVAARATRPCRRAAVDARSERQAGQPRLIVDQHGAGAAFAAVATRFRSGQPDDFPQIIQQQHIVRIASLRARPLSVNWRMRAIRLQYSVSHEAFFCRADSISASATGSNRSSQQTCTATRLRFAAEPRLRRGASAVR